MKMRFGILWAILAVALLVGFPVLLFCTVPGTYTPPAPGTMAAQVPPLPAPASSGGSAQAEAALMNTAGKPAGVSEDEQKTASDVWIEAQAKAFYERHPTLQEKEVPYLPDNLRKDLFDLGFAVLKQIESDETLLEFARHSDPAVRAAAIRALAVACNTLHEDGHGALLAFLRRQSQDDMEWLVLAATEVLVEETRTGIYWGHGGALLWMGGDYARPAIPHLIWASDNAQDANARISYMNAATFLDPDAQGIRDMLRRRLSDPDPIVRLNALQAAALLQPIRNYQNENGQYPSWYLQLRPGDEMPSEEGIVTVPMEEKRLAAK